jgi:hypothetical protein
MHNSGGAPASSKSTVLRLLIAFVLGLPMGLPYSFISSSPSIAWWRYGVPVAVLVGAMLLSILLDPDVRQGAICLTSVKEEDRLDTLDNSFQRKPGA